MKVALSGALGKMGYELSEMIARETDWQVLVGVDRGESPSPPLFSLVPNFDQIKNTDIDLVIDFSLPELFAQALQWSVQNKVPMVSGTTGLSENDFTLLSKAAKEIPVLWAPNMSLGITWLHSVINELAQLEGFDFQIEETHHRNKKDSPSGTAVYLQKELDRVLKKKNPAPLSIRGGGVFGVHKIHAMGREESITLEHVALNRAVFARGAVQAGQWLIHQPNGLYNLSDVLGDR